MRTEEEEKEIMDRMYAVFTYFYRKLDEDEEISYESLETNALGLTRIYFETFIKGEK